MKKLKIQLQLDRHDGKVPKLGLDVKNGFMSQTVVENFMQAKKKKGHFHHSSFLAGGAIRAAGGIKVREGKLLEINPNSGHYKPAQHHFKALVERLVNEGIDIKDVKVISPNENLEKRLMAKYKFKRLAMFSMVYDELMRDANNTINQKIDFMDRHVSIFKRNVTETINSCKESIKDWIRRIMPGDDDMAENHIPDNDQQNGASGAAPRRIESGFGHEGLQDARSRQTTKKSGRPNSSLPPQSNE